MGAAVSAISVVVTSVTWCLCTASWSLCTACFGNDKTTAVAPSATSGRKRSVLLLLLAVGLALAFQYGIAPRLQPDKTVDDWVPFAGDYLIDAWTDGCTHLETAQLIERCSGNAGVYRVGTAALLFFVLAAVGAACKRTANREAWPAKYVFFLLAVFGTIFVPNEPWFTPLFLNVARVGAIFFVVVQQIILIDVAYNMNDHAVQRANDAETTEGPGKGNKWLVLILILCTILFAGSVVVWGLLFYYFGGCSINLAFIVITVILSVLVTVAQLSGEESSLLTSAIIVAYATYLCLTAVTKNPNGDCNPRLGDRDLLGIFLGIGFTILSLAWTSYSFTAEKRVSNPMSASMHNNNAEDPDPNGSYQSPQPKDVKGVVMDGDVEENDNASAAANARRRQTDNDARQSRAQADLDEAQAEGRSFNLSINLNLILGLVTCFFAMVLTGWGSIQVGGDAANPSVSRVSMWMIIGAQWMALSIYLWTMTAPRLFPDRDFS